MDLKDGRKEGRKEGGHLGFALFEGRRNLKGEFVEKVEKKDRKSGGSEGAEDFNKML